jgi:hypothetical protein
MWLTRTAKSWGSGIPTLMPSSQDNRANDGGKKARSPGRARRTPLKPLRRECRMTWLNLVVTAASFSYCWRAMGEAFTRHSLRPLTFEGQANGKARTCQRRENDGARVLFWLFDMQICAVVPDKRAERRITETHAPSLVAVLVSVSLDTLDSKGDLSRLSRTQQRRRPFSPLLPLDCLASTYRSDFRISRSAASRHRRLRHRGGGAAPPSSTRSPLVTRRLCAGGCVRRPQVRHTQNRSRHSSSAMGGLLTRVPSNTRSHHTSALPRRRSSRVPVVE